MIKDKWKRMSHTTRFGLLLTGVGILMIFSALTRPHRDLIEVILALFVTWFGLGIFLATKGEKSEDVE